MTHVLAIAHFAGKGERILKTFRDLGCRITLLSRSELQDKPWPRHLVDEVFFVNDFRNGRDVVNAISYLHQDRDFEIVAPLDEYAVGTCARVRAHLGCPGLCEGTARKVRDKLTMRTVARSSGIPVPDFSGFNNKARIARLLQRTDGPWMVKPRAAGGAVRIQKLHTREQVWSVYESMGDQRSHHLIEEFLPSKVFHVDTVIHKGKVLLEVPGEYTTPPFDVWHTGGVFGARTVKRGSKLCGDLLELNRKVLDAVGVKNGVNHAEYLLHGDKVYFLEIAARVPGSNLDQLATASTGVDLYAEIAKIQYCGVTGTPYKLGKFQYKEAGLVQCLAQQERPPLGQVGELPEVTWTWSQDFHVGVAFASPKFERVEELTNWVLERFTQDNLAVLPASEQPA